MPDLRLGVAPEALTWRPNFALRGLVKLPVVFEAGGAETEEGIRPV
jgi:hypothetical protein